MYGIGYGMIVNLNIISYNVRGIANNEKRKEIFHYLNKKAYDIVFLQETQC